MPLASTIARPATSATPSRSWSTVKLSSMIVSTPAASTGLDLVDAVDLHFEVRRVRELRAHGEQRIRHASPLCAVSTARWLSLAITASDSEKRWLWPPPERTA